MQKFRFFIFVVIGCVGLTACTTYDDAVRETVYYNGEVDVDMSYSEMAREVSNGSVQVYGLEGPVPVMPDPRNILMATDGGIPSSVDPNVTIFPLTDFPAAPVVRTPPPLQPPSRDYRPMQSPFDGPLQTPAPLDGPVMLEPQPPLQFMPRSDAVPSPAAPVTRPSGTSRVYFKHGSSRVNQTGTQVVDFVSRGNTGNKIVVEGHASERADTRDPVERSIVNLKVSMDRAFKVSSDLIRKGVPPQNIETRAYGDTKSPGYIEGLDNEAAARRVEIKSEITGTGVPASTGAPIPPLVRY